jgi:hypothetical protein
VRYADGRMAQAPSDRMTARRLFEPPRDRRRPLDLSYAAIGMSSSMA